MRGAGNNNGLVLLFETGEDLSLVQQLFAKHSHDVFYDVVKGVSCLDHYLRVSRPGRPASYTWPSYQFKEYIQIQMVFIHVDIENFTLKTACLRFMSESIGDRVIVDQ